MIKDSTSFKKITIQNLEKRPQPQTCFPQKQKLIYKMNQFFKWSDYPSQCYMDSGIGKERVLDQNGLLRVSHFFSAFLHAYTKHGDIVLVPDQIWIMILFYLSTYIDTHAEKLRKRLVKHQGVKVLTVVEAAPNAQMSLLMQKNWDYFFDQIIQKIEQETVSGVVEALACNFSTTTKTYKTISTAIIMSSLKKYFQYHRELAGCGINNVYMAGERQDWVKIVQKLENLIKFDVDGTLKKYIQHMRVILQNFLLTFDQKPNIGWWNTVMKTYQQRQQYGGDQTQIQGWILHFFGVYQKTSYFGFPQFTVKVPIKLTNTLTNQQKSLMLVSDWVSVSKLNQRAYKPDIGMCIFTLNSGSPKKASRVQKDIETYKQRLKLNQEVMKINKVPVVLSFYGQKKQKLQSKTVPKKSLGNPYKKEAKHPSIKKM